MNLDNEQIKFKKIKEKKEFQKKVAFTFYAYGSKAIDKLIFEGSKQFTINEFEKINYLRKSNGLEPLEFWDMFAAGNPELNDELSKN